MEYMSRGDMQAYLDDQGRMTEQEAQRLFRQLLSALNHCHKRGIVHWDLKPSNLFLDVDHNVKIAHFSLSYDYFPGEKLGTFCNTPAFAAPEIFLELMYLGPPVDVWSLGVILYIMVTGFEPFQGQDYQEMKQSVLTGHYHVPNDLAIIVNSKHATLIASMLTLDPTTRAPLPHVRQHLWVKMDEKKPLQPRSTQDTSGTRDTQSRSGIHGKSGTWDKSRIGDINSTQDRSGTWDTNGT
ncbi:serine/threonine-protein kinase MARK2-like [Cervus canadensis]|uniref:serine/threonine-protein kinase MARK2-like n=1 Tax=Cervus canadensis TaxID=1574408 RepID=UPI001C9E418A|nr:serine/threonine-protein kinase MARK2-like [Cervus canadensis]